jgi:hypothetical protein
MLVDSFNGPAPKRTDAKLFAGMSPALNKLAKAGRAGLRLNARAAFWNQKQAAAQQAAQSGPTPQAQ